jgi:hypothetical protein
MTTLESRSLSARLWAGLALLLASGSAQAQFSTNNIRSDGTWRATSPAPAAGWNTNISFNDSDAAGWEDAFKSPQGDKIWFRSNLSAQAPNQAWFRHLFFLSDNTPFSAQGTFLFDDDGEAYLNGTLVVNDTGGGATTTKLQLDPALFHPGTNLVAVHGIDTHTPYNNIAVNMTIVSVARPARLTLNFSGNRVAVSWTPAGGHLELSSALGPNAHWQNITTNNPVTMPLLSGTRFFRVVNP